MRLTSADLTEECDCGDGADGHARGAHCEHCDGLDWHHAGCPDLDGKPTTCPCDACAAVQS